MTLPQSLAALRELHKAGRFEEARGLAQAVLRAAPHHAEALHLAGATEYLAGRPDLALPLLERARTVEPNNPAHHRALGAALKALGRDKEALAAFETALAQLSAAPPALDPVKINQSLASHHLQGRPTNHVHYRRSRSVDESLRLFVNSLSNNADDSARAYFLIDNVARTLARGVPGALAELGVWRGHTARLLKAAAPGRVLYLFDTFEGFVPEDLPPDDRRRQLFRDTSLDAVKAYVGADEVVYCPGVFPASAAALPSELRFALAHVDCDVHAPTKAGLEFFYPRLNPGGLLIVHDYANDAWPGVAQAVDEFLADKPEGVIVIPDKAGTAVLVKV